MKVKELIKMLSEQEQEAMVVISGYEGGVDEFRRVDDVFVKLNVNNAWYYGNHEVADRVSPGDIIPETHVRAVFLN